MIRFNQLKDKFHLRTVFELFLAQKQAPRNSRSGTMQGQNSVDVKPETRNHKGFFVQQGSYKFVGIDQSGWALICIDEASCHYVDPDNLKKVPELVEG
jgi:hypothetical protein